MNAALRAYSQSMSTMAASTRFQKTAMKAVFPFGHIVKIVWAAHDPISQKRPASPTRTNRRQPAGIHHPSSHHCHVQTTHHLGPIPLLTLPPQELCPHTHRQTHSPGLR
jgi:hypothetical protein